MREFIFASLALAAGLLASNAVAETPERIQRGQLVMEGIPEIPPQLSAELGRYDDTRSARLADWRPQGDGMLVITRFGETPQVHHVREPMAARRQLTFFDEPMLAAAYPESGDAPPGFIVGKDVGGSEDYQLFLVAEDGVAQLTEGGGRKGGALWSDGAERAAWYETSDTGDWRIQVAEADALASPRVAWEAPGAWMPLDWSEDAQRLLMLRYVSITESELHLLDLRTGEAAEVNPADGPVAYTAAQFAPGDDAIVYVSDEDADFSRLVVHALDGTAKRILSRGIEWNVEAFDVADDGTVALVVNERGLSKLQLRRLSDGQVLAAPELPPGIITDLQFSPDGRRVGFTLAGPDAVGDVWSWAPERRTLERWTDSELGGLDAEEFVSPELVSWRSFDGLEISGFVYEPENPGPHPAVILIHGGPESQYRPYFSATVQHWVKEMGLAVVAPNVRGSAGYGKRFVALDNALKREDSVRDVGALIDWMRSQPERFDADRVGLYGGSYGGYMVYATLVHYDEKIAAAVPIVAISSFVTFLENTRGYRQDLRRAEYGDERNPEMRAFLDAISPLQRSEDIGTPMFVIQGANDPRVPASEAEQMLEAVRGNGGEAWYLLAMDEGHGFRKKSNQDFMRAAVAAFWQAFLLTPGADVRTAD